MSRFACPNKNSQAWRDLVGAVGEEKSYRLFYEYNYDIPDLNKINTFIVNEDLDRVKGVIDDQLKSLNAKLNRYRAAQNEKNFEDNQSRMNEINKSIQETLRKIDSQQYVKAVAELVTNAKEDLERMDGYISNKSNRSKPEFIGTVLQYKKFIEDHAKIAIPEFGYGKKVLTDNINEVNNLVNKLNREIYNEVEKFVESNVKEYSSNKKLFESPEELRKVLKEVTDLSLADTYLGDIFSSPDALLANAGKIFREKQLAIHERNDAFEKKLKKAGNNLARFNGRKADFSFMIEKDGRYLQKNSVEYKKKDNEMVKKGRDDEGQYMEYYRIVSAENADPKHVAHNLKLRAIKQEIKEWKSPEIVDEVTGEFRDGENHRYTQEFKDERAKHEELVYTEKKFWRWEKKSDVTDESYSAFRQKYYQVEKEMWVGREDGTVSLSRISFPKNEYVETTEKWHNKRYSSLMSDETPLGKAQRDFYNMFVEEFENGALSRLPSTIKRKMIGRLPVVQKARIKQLTDKGEGFLRAAAKQLRRYVTPDYYSAGRLVDEQGFAKNDVPIFYVADLKDQEKINKLEAAIEANKNNPEKFKELTDRLQNEMRKLEDSQISTDLVESLIKFNAMAENYEVMKELESSLLAFKDVIETRNYVKKAGKNVELIQGKKSNVAKSFENWMNLVFYQTDDADPGMANNIAKKLQQYTSFKGLALSPISAANNAIMANIAQRIESFGGILFSRENYSKATKLFNLEYLPNVMKELTPTGDGPYKTNKSYSKYSAMVKEFNFIGAKHEEAGLDSVFFSLQNAGEFAAQSRSGIAMIMDYKVKDAEGNEISLYDAYTFNQSTGEVELKPGIKFTAKDKSKLSTKLREANAYIHGRYGAEEKVVLQSHYLGRLAMQFHRWCYPAFKARFKETYFDESLGISLEGRYRTLISLFHDVQGFSVNVLQNYNNMNEMQKANMRKNMAELGFFIGSFMLYHLFKHLKDELDEDDTLTAEVLGWFTYQASRQRSEISTFLNPSEMLKLAKNPIPVLGTLSQAMNVMGAGLGIPYNIAIGEGDNNYYNSGIAKGDLKFMKKAVDLIPVIKMVNQWDSIQRDSDFFIGGK